jgi:two-component system phosphate regulon sensor histidine kinase PhoR
VFIEVKDKGIGISEEDQQKVFDKFYRVSSGLVHTTKGTGLGLSLVKQIMEAHKGKIILKSKIGEGSIFKLVFPKNSQLINGDKNA